MASRKGIFGLTAALAASVAVILGGVYEDEGGYANHPDDPGGATKYGVTQEVAREAGWEGDMIDFPKQCDGPEAICADSIYLANYIMRPGYLPIIETDPAVGEELVNSAVNFGPARPSKWFQQSLNELAGAKLEVDGIAGRRTAEAFRRYRAATGAAGCRRMLDRLDARQLSEYQRLVRVNPRLKVFYRGWVRLRIGNVDRAKCEAKAA